MVSDKKRHLLVAADERQRLLSAATSFDNEDSGDVKRREFARIDGLRQRIEAQTRQYTSVRLAAEAYEEEADDLQTRFVFTTATG